MEAVTKRDQAALFLTCMRHRPGCGDLLAGRAYVRGFGCIWGSLFSKLDTLKSFFCSILKIIRNSLFFVTFYSSQEDSGHLSCPSHHQKQIHAPCKAKQSHSDLYVVCCHLPACCLCEKALSNRESSSEGPHTHNPLLQCGKSYILMLYIF